MKAENRQKQRRSVREELKRQGVYLAPGLKVRRKRPKPAKARCLECRQPLTAKGPNGKHDYTFCMKAKGEVREAKQGRA